MYTGKAPCARNSKESKVKRRNTFMMWLLLSVLWLTVGCSTIDDDLSDCDNSYELDYELRLVTNMTTELQTQLSMQTDIAISAVLKNHLANIFTDFAHDVDLSFYDTKADSIRLHHDEHIMNANQQSYTLYIPRQKYMHLAVANIVDDPLTDLQYDEHCHTSKIVQTPPSLWNGTAQSDTIDSHTTGLFTARQLMEMIEGVNQTFNVKLFMANCAAALVMDTRGHARENIKVYSSGFATGFNVCDSTYTYTATPPVVRTTLLQAEDSEEQAYCSVTFPSPESSKTRTVIETVEPFIAEPDENGLWEFRVYVPQPDGTITETILRVKEPLRAGQLRIIKCWLGDHGEVKTLNSEVGTSVTLDWKDGLIIEG